LAIRETNNASTGLKTLVVLFRSLHERRLCYTVWNLAEDRDFPLNLGKYVVDYLVDLKTQLEAAQESALEHTCVA